MNLIYLKDDEITKYLEKKSQYNYKLSTFDTTTNTLLLYNPLEKTLTLFDCELELQKVKRKVKLLDIPKPAKLSKSKTSKLYHKQSMILSSGRKKLSLIANNDEINEILEMEAPSSDSFKFETMTYKIMLGYLKHSLKEKQNDTLNERLNSIFNPIFKEKFFKNSINNNFLKNMNEKINDSEEKVTFNLCTYVKKSQLFYFIGTDKGNVYMFPFLFHYNWNYYPLFIFLNKNKPEPVKNLYVEKNCLFIEQGDYDLITLELNFESDSEETKAFFSKSGQNKELLLNEDIKGIQEIIVNKWLKSKILLDSSITSFSKIKTLKFFDENGQLFEQNEPKYSFFKINLSPIGLILHTNNAAIYSMQSHKIELTLKGNNSKVLGIFLHPFLDEIMTFNAKGYLYVYNIPTGILDRIISIENYSHLFNFNRYINESYLKYNIHSCKKFQEIEENQTSKQNIYLDYSLRYENYLLDYSIGKEWMSKKSESPTKPVASSNILNSMNAFNNPSIELSGGEMNNLGNNNNSNNNLINSSMPLLKAEKMDELNSQMTYDKKKIESSGLIIFERNGFFLQGVKKAEKEHAIDIHNIIEGRKTIVKSHNKDQGICVMALDPLENAGNSQKFKKPNNDRGHIVFFDGKINARNMKLLNENDQIKSVQLPLYFSYVSMIFPWGIDKEFDQKVLAKTNNKVPVFQMLTGVQGIGESFTFLMNSKDKWAISDYYSTLHAIALLYFVTSFEEKELKTFTNFILQIIEAFSKKKKLHEKINPCINLSLICKFFLDSDGELMTAAYNLLISSMKNRDIDFNFVLEYPLELYRLTTESKIKPENFSYSQIIWILMIGYTSVFHEKSRKLAEICVKDIIALTK